MYSSKYKEVKGTKDGFWEEGKEIIKEYIRYMKTRVDIDIVKKEKEEIEEKIRRWKEENKVVIEEIIRVWRELKVRYDYEKVKELREDIRRLKEEIDRLNSKLLKKE